MAEYIEREALVRQIICNMAEFVGAPDEVQRHDEYCNYAINIIEDAPAADIADVVHGEWLRSDDDWNSLTTIQCSLCSEEWCFETDDDVSLLNYKYCPNCGAKMDGGFDDGKRCD